MFGKCIVLPSSTPNLNYPLLVSVEGHRVFISRLDLGHISNLKLV